MCQSQSTTSLLTLDLSYGFSELCDKYKDKNSSMKVGLPKLETESESCQVEVIESVGKQRLNMTLETNLKNSTFRYR